MSSAASGLRSQQHSVDRTLSKHSIEHRVGITLWKAPEQFQERCRQEQSRGVVSSASGVSFSLQRHLPETTSSHFSGLYDVFVNKEMF